MANKVIKGLTVEIGGDTTKLGKALEDVEKKSRSLSGELGSINKLLKLDPKNTELLAQKQKVLAEAVSNTEDKLGKLKEAERQVQEQFKEGKASEDQVRALQREIIETTNKLKTYERAVEETADAVKQLGDNSDGAAKDVDDLATKEKKAEKEADDLGDTLDTSLGAGLKAVAALAAAAGAALIGAVESTQEYRTEMGKLDTAFTTAGHSSEAATETYKELQSVLGETDQAVEAANHLAELTDNEQDLRKWTNICTGVFAKFGDSLPIEGLTEAANETAKTGELTGSLADALNWAGVSEEDFQAKLEECTDEQERQSLITETLNGLYADAAQQYKTTNREVIKANRANEEWTSTLAELGGEVQPLVTDIKNMGTTILKSAKEPLADVADFVREKVIPALTSISTWVLNNGSTIKNVIVTTTAVLAAYKAATIAAEVAQNGLKATILATTVAQKALALAQAATPWGLAAVAVTGVVTALIAFNASADEATQKVDVLTEEERELMASAREAADAFRDQQAATAENVEGITSQMGYVQDLADELQGLADASGRVQEKDQARAQFILNELNEALGTEYLMTDGVIQKYDELKTSIDSVILAKTANSLLEANNANYVAAIQGENEALKNLVLSEKDYQNQLAITQAKEQEYADLKAEADAAIDAARTENDYRSLASLAQKLNNVQAEMEAEQKLLAEKEKLYQEDAANYGNHSNTIQNYEEAQQAVLEGNHARAVEILKSKSGNYLDYADNVDQATREAIDSLYKEAVDAGLAAERTKRNFESGVEGYTQEMVDEAEKGYEEALDAWATAKVDAESVGKDLSTGLGSGMDSQKSSLISKARSIVSSIIGAFRQEADSHSPSRKMIDFGEDMGEGAAIGMENKTDRLDEVARDQVDGLLGTYAEAGTTSGQSVFRAIQGEETARRSQSYQTLAGGTSDKLDKILAAIERGQVLTIDGDQLVGATANRLDNKLGQRRALVARGAI